jgi:hypothetical protein
MAGVRPLCHRNCVGRAGRASMSPALLPSRRMSHPPADPLPPHPFSPLCPCWHSLPIGASASTLWRTLRLLCWRIDAPMLRCARIAGVARVLFPCLADAATGRWV